MAIYAPVARRHAWPGVPIAILEKWRAAEFGPSARTLLRVVKDTLDIWAGERAVTALVVLAMVLWFTTRRARPRSREPRLLLAVFVAATTIHVQFGRLAWPGRYQAYLLSLGFAAARRARHPADKWLSSASGAGLT